MAGRLRWQCRYPRGRTPPRSRRRTCEPARGWSRRARASAPPRPWLCRFPRPPSPAQARCARTSRAWRLLWPTRAPPLFPAPGWMRRQWPRGLSAPDTCRSGPQVAAQIVVVFLQPVMPDGAEDVQVERVLEGDRHVRHVGRNVQYLPFVDHNLLAADLEFERAFQNVSDLLAFVMMLRHHRALGQEDLGDHRLVAGNDLAGNRGAKDFLFHFVPNVVFHRGSHLWTLRVPKRERIQVLQHTGRGCLPPQQKAVHGLPLPAGQEQEHSLVVEPRRPRSRRRGL